MGTLVYSTSVPILILNISIFVVEPADSFDSIVAVSDQ